MLNTSAPAASQGAARRHDGDVDLKLLKSGFALLLLLQFLCIGLFLAGDEDLPVHRLVDLSVAGLLLALIAGAAVLLRRSLAAERSAPGAVALIFELDVAGGARFLERPGISWAVPVALPAGWLGLRFAPVRPVELETCRIRVDVAAAWKLVRHEDAYLLMLALQEPAEACLVSLSFSSGHASPAALVQGWQSHTPRPLVLGS